MFIPNNHSSVFALDENNSQDESTLDNSDSSRALTINPIATLTVTPSAETPQETLTGPNQTVYRTHDVSITLNDVSSYGLSISYADNTNNTLKYEGDGTGNSTIAGANNQSGAALIPNTWGYAWDTTSTNNSDLLYQTMPNYGDNSHKLISANDLSANTELETIDGRIVFAAKFADDAPYGHYRTKVLLSLAAMPHIVTNYQITYDCTGGTNCPENFSEESLASTYTYQIPNNTPTKANYTFLGYSTSNTATTAEYTANATIDLSQDNPSKDLYAMWKANTWDGGTVNNWNDLEYMQQMTSAACTSALKLAPKTVKDSRDGNTYTITKLDDNKCWMTTNLRLTGDSLIANGNTAMKITPTDSNIDSDYEVSESSGHGWKDNGKLEQKVYYTNSNDGGYYTWCMATAGTCLQGTDTEVKEKDAPYSICPKGWRLPKKDEYSALVAKGASKVDSNVNDGVFDGYKIAGGFFRASGCIYHSSLTGIGSGGYYWSSTAYDSNQAYGLNFNSSNASVKNSYQYGGYSVRCIAE